MGDPSRDTLPDFNDDEALIVETKRRFRLVAEAEAKNREEGVLDLKFLVGDQWADDIKRDREENGRPCLVINRIPQFINLIVNEQRLNPPAIKVSPTNSRASPEKARIRQGLIRHIEYASSAQLAYINGARLAAIIGWGYARILTAYADARTFDQILRIEPIQNTFSVYMDPNIMYPDGRDADFCIIGDDMARQDYIRQHPGSNLAATSSWDSTGDREWINTDTVRLVEHFYKEWHPDTLVEMDDGVIALASELPPHLPSRIRRMRDTEVPRVKWAKMNGMEVLERCDWPGKYIPILRFIGDENFVEGQRILSGIVRAARDPQRMINFWAASEAELIALSPKAPYIGAEGQFDGHEAMWEQANTRNFPFLTYNPVTSSNGQLAPPPQRVAIEPPVMAVTNARRQAEDSLKAVTGTYDAALGAIRNEQSGVAIARRNAQTQISTAQYKDNTNATVRHCGRILLDLLPHVYSEPRVVRIINPDDSEELIAINQMFEKNGERMEYRLDDGGEYEAVISEGPPYQTLRQEATEAMQQLIQASPQILALIGDLWVKSMDIPGAEELSDRLKFLLPPQFQKEPTTGQKPLPPQAQAQLQQMAQMIDALQKELRASTETLLQKRPEIESKERIAFKQLEVELLKKQMDIEGDTAKMLLDAELSSIRDRLRLLEVNEPIEASQSPSLAQSVSGVLPSAPVQPATRIVSGATGGSAVPTPLPGDPAPGPSPLEVASGAIAPQPPPGPLGP